MLSKQAVHVPHCQAVSPDRPPCCLRQDLSLACGSPNRFNRCDGVTVRPEDLPISASQKQNYKRTHHTRQVFCCFALLCFVLSRLWRSDSGPVLILSQGARYRLSCLLSNLACYRLSCLLNELARVRNLRRKRLGFQEERVRSDPESV